MINGLLGAIDGLTFTLREDACAIKEYVQFRFPVSKRKRIRKKWAKRSKNFRTQKTKEVIIQDPLDKRHYYVGAKVWSVIQKKLREYE